VSLLLDTHVLLWWLADSPRLSTQVRVLIRDPKLAVWVSAASVWEIAIKKSLGKLDAPDDLSGAIAAYNFHPLPIEMSHALAAGALPRLHEDPFDRMLVAQAKIENLTLVTADQRLAAYEASVLLL